MITQKTIQKFYLLQSRRKELESAARKIQKEEDEFKAIILKALKKKDRCEDGAYIVQIKYGGRYPSWKEEFTKLAGDEAVAEIVANTSPSESVEVVVNEEYVQ